METQTLTKLTLEELKSRAEQLGIIKIINPVTFGHLFKKYPEFQYCSVDEYNDSEEWEGDEIKMILLGNKYLTIQFGEPVNTLDLDSNLLPDDTSQSDFMSSEEGYQMLLKIFNFFKGTQIPLPEEAEPVDNFICPPPTRFFRIGLEPTFYSNIKIPGSYWTKMKQLECTDNESEREGNIRNHHNELMPDFKQGSLGAHIQNEIVNKYKEYFTSYSEDLKSSTDTMILGTWIGRTYNDQGVLEIPSPVFDSNEVLNKSYEELLKLTKKHNFVPSSTYCMESEGGCHVNVELARIQKKEKFMEELRNVLCNNPSIVWAFLSPYDNSSSNFHEIFNDSYVERNKDVRRRKNNEINKDISCYGKGCFMRWVSRHQTNTERVELRFFMMPRTFSEFKLHNDFAQAFIHYINERVNAGLSTKIRTDFWLKLKSYTFEKAETELKNICAKMNFDFSQIEECGKMKLLKQRFDFGEKYFI